MIRFIFLLLFFIPLAIPLYSAGVEVRGPGFRTGVDFLIDPYQGKTYQEVDGTERAKSYEENYQAMRDAGVDPEDIYMVINGQSVDDIQNVQAQGSTLLLSIGTGIGVYQRSVKVEDIDEFGQRPSYKSKVIINGQSEDTSPNTIHVP